MELVSCAQNQELLTGRLPKAKLPAEPLSQSLIGYLARHPITVMPPLGQISMADILKYQERPGQLLVTCDFYIEGIERRERLGCGYRSGSVINIDHHAPAPEMQRQISSTNLALLYVRDFGHCAPGDLVLINHLDCDSVLSSLIMRGAVPPRPLFGAAAIAADHTGRSHPIADLLQALAEPAKQLGGQQGLLLMARNLARLLSGELLEPAAEQALRERLAKQRLAESLVKSDGIKFVRGVALIATDKKIDSELLLPLLPGAELIICATPRQNGGGVWNTTLRLGAAAPPQLTMFKLELDQGIDANAHGRWNAFSNSRSGGSDMDPEQYARLVAERIEAVRGSWPAGQTKNR